MLVVDTSAVLHVLLARPRDERLVNRLTTDGDLHAPHLIDVEFVHALRRLVLTGEIDEARAAEVRIDYADLTIVRYAHSPLTERMWELRNNLTAYDAAFAALSEALGVSLVTCDARLASAPGIEAPVEVYGRRSKRNT